LPGIILFLKKGANMPKAIKTYVRYVDAVNKKVGKFALYMVFALMGLLLYESISRTIFNAPHIWVVEVAQFIMAAYYLLGGGYSMILKGHVRMDLLYGRWSPKGQALADTITASLLIFYLVFLLIGGISSIEYAVQYGQRNYTPWAPPLAPIKIIMTIGIVLMLLQAIATFFRDLAKVRGEEIT
jgi:TRAP-type mannitol/chloroaromatic compound transport system permease small subunit